MQRNHAFDLLCGICIVRMIMLHISDACDFSHLIWWRELMHWTYYFMSFFFFKAGYFNKTISGSTSDFVKAKAKSLLVPYVTWGLIGCAMYMSFVWFVFPPNNPFVRMVTVEHLWETSQVFGNGPLWFLASFFTAYVFMHLLTRIPSLLIPMPGGRGVRLKAHWLVLFFPVLSWWLYRQGNPWWFSLNNVPWGIFLFFVGRLWRVIIDRLRRRYALPLSLVLLGCFVVLNLLDNNEYTMSSNIWNGNFLITFPKTLLALCGLSGVFLSLHVPRVPILSFIGQHSMVFFVAHFPLLTFYQLVRSARVHSLHSQWDDYILLTFFIFLVLILAVPYVERVPWLSGRWPKKAQMN